MNVILVGNGKSVLDKKLGTDIDKFDIVVRFNNFQLEGFEEYVGSKTDIIARRACDDIRLHKVVNEKPKILTFVAYSRWSTGMLKVARDVKGYYGSTCEIVPLEICKKTGEKLNLDQPINESCSVGILAIDYFLKKYSKIYLHGFDGDGHISHYFPKPPKDGSFHAWEKEQAFIKKLKGEGVLACLNVAIS